MIGSDRRTCKGRVGRRVERPVAGHDACGTFQNEEMLVLILMSGIGVQLPGPPACVSDVIAVVPIGQVSWQRAR